MTLTKNNNFTKYNFIPKCSCLSHNQNCIFSRFNTECDSVERCDDQGEKDKGGMCRITSTSTNSCTTGTSTLLRFAIRKYIPCGTYAKQRKLQSPQLQHSLQHSLQLHLQ